MARGEAEKSRTLTEAQAVASSQERDVALAQKARLSEDLQHLSKEVNKISCLLPYHQCED